MTGAEHYDEALRLLAESGRWSDDVDACRRRGDLVAFETGDRRARAEHDREALESSRKARRCMDAAQVHATLANAAASALTAITNTTAVYPAPGRQLADDDHTHDAACDWHARITTEGEDNHRG